ncbi:hypothetical protein FJZ19_00865 [Candidatus Pacearchaeota archaeon]|nr:hypothetical protein [Candidatus Pacearchaeota archaeon]
MKLIRLTENNDGSLVTTVNGKDFIVQARRIGHPFVIDIDERDIKFIDEDSKLQRLCRKSGANAYYCEKTCSDFEGHLVIEPYTIIGRLPREKKIQAITRSQLREAIKKGRKFKIDDPKIASVQLYEDTFKNIQKRVISAGQSLLVGDNVPALLPLIQRMPDYLLFWVFNRNFMTDKGFYVIQDSKSEFDRKIKPEKLEKMLKDGKEIQGVRFSKDRKLRFCKYPAGPGVEEDYKEIARGEFFKVNFGLSGAKKLAEYLRITTQNFGVFGSFNPEWSGPTAFQLTKHPHEFEFQRGDDTGDKRFTFGVEYKK